MEIIYHARDGEIFVEVWAIWMLYAAVNNVLCSREMMIILSRMII